MQTTRHQEPDEYLWFDWLGRERVAAYMMVSANVKLSTLADWNQKISGALLADIGHVEVALRNMLHSQLSTRHTKRDQQGSWLDDPSGELARMGGPLILSRIESARAQVRKVKPRISESDLIAELSLGFWLSLFSSKFRGLQPDLISGLNGLDGRNVRSVSALFSRFRTLRNRLAHNHRVIHRDLVADWALILQVAGVIHQVLAREIQRMSEAPRLIHEFNQTIQAKF